MRKGKQGGKDSALYAVGSCKVDNPGDGVCCYVTEDGEIGVYHLLDSVKRLWSAGGRDLMVTGVAFLVVEGQETKS